MNQLASLSILANTAVNYKTPPTEQNIFTFHIYLFRKGLSEREYLLFHRFSQSDQSVSGIWQTLNGSPKLNESWEDAVKRVVYEKSRLKIHHVHKTDFMVRSAIKPSEKKRALDKKYVEERIFFAQLEDDLLPEIAQEHNAFGWFNYPKAHRLLTLDASKSHLEIIQQAATPAL